MLRLPKRHGDLILMPINELPDFDKLTETGSTVLAVGETTGHKHQIRGSQVLVYEDEAQTKYVSIKGSAQLVHEEHNTIDLEPGVYKVINEREFDPFLEEIERRVQD